MAQEAMVEEGTFALLRLKGATAVQREGGNLCH